MKSVWVTKFRFSSSFCLFSFTKSFSFLITSDFIKNNLLNNPCRKIVGKPITTGNLLLITSAETSISSLRLLIKFKNEMVKCITSLRALHSPANAEHTSPLTLFLAAPWLISHAATSSSITLLCKHPVSINVSQTRKSLLHNTVQLIGFVNMSSTTSFIDTESFSSLNIIEQVLTF